MPESYFPGVHQVNKNYDDYPLRPEFIESSYFLFKKTSHPFYRLIGERIINNLQAFTRVDCGFTSIGVIDFRKDDRMDSFFLSETVKYLYLLFDDDHWIDKKSFLFTTEAHLIPFKPPPFDKSNVCICISF